jgi:DNA-binding SARP family transcriptional activator
VHLLGGLVVEGIHERALGSRQGRTVLKVLALARGAPVPATRLADVLWGDAPVARPEAQVGVLVSRLRGVLGPDHLPRSDAGYSLVVDWLDLDELEARAAEAAAALDAGRLVAARAAAGAAVALAHGPLLPDDEGAWVEGPRASAAATLQRARLVGVEAAAEAGDHRAVGALAEAALADDPYDETVLRALMRSHARAGRPASALAAYARARARLADDLGVSPTAETEALHAALVAGDGHARDHDLVDAPSPRGTAPRLVGRDDVLRRLDEALAAVAEGASHLVQVVGEAGVGRTSVVSAWVAALAPTVPVLQGRGDVLGRHLPLDPVLAALARHLAGRPPAEVDDVLGPDAAAVRGVLGLNGPGAGASSTVVADADADRALLFAALVRVVERLGPGPVVVVVDDLRWAGPSTDEWLRLAAHRSQGLLIVTTDLPDAPAVDDATRLVLGPLDEDAVAALVGAEAAPDLHRRSGGHPLLLRTLADAEAGHGASGDLADAVHRWTQGLGSAGTTVETASILGADVDLDLLAAVTARPAVDVLGDLEQAAAAGLLVEQGDGFAFRHELVREALEQGASGARRALVHRAAARALNARPDPDPLVVAVHARLGGDRSLAVGALVRAAQVAAHRGDVDTAEAHLDEAVGLGATAAALVERARVRMSRFRLDGAAADVAAARDLDDDAPTLELAAWIAYYRRRYAEASALADEGVRRAAGDPALRSSCLAVAGRARHGAGDLGGGVACLEEAVATDAPLAVRGVAGVWLAHAHLHRGRPDEALRAVEVALVDADRFAHPFAPLHGWFARALALGHLGRPTEALSACDVLDLAVERSGRVGERFVGPAANARAWVLRWTGCEEQADDCNRVGVDASYSDAAMSEAHYAGLLDLADGCLLRGDHDGAAALLSDLAPMDDWDGTMAWCQRHRLGLLRARLALLDGDADGAASAAGAVADDAARRGAHRHELVARAVAGLAGAGSTEELDAVVRDLGACAGLDGWRVVAELAGRRGNEAWRVVAETRAGALVSASADAVATRRLVERTLAASVGP